MTKMKRILILQLVFLIPIIGIAQQPAVKVTIKGNLQSIGMRNKMESNVSKLLTDINQAFANNQQLFDPKGEYLEPEVKLSIQDMWANYHFRCTGDQISEDLLMKPQKGYQIRNIPMLLSSGQEMNAVIEFGEQGIINNFWFGLEQQQYKNILNYDGIVDLTRRELIVNFLENLRTAYIRKDIGFIETVYSDKALIIVGKVVTPDPRIQDAVQSGLSPVEVEYVTQTKKEYLVRLKNVFDKNEYLNLIFNDIQVIKHRKYDNFYGVTLVQKWNSTSYSDTGILFFMIQFRENENPLIWVRTWQDPKYTKPEEVFGFHNFIIK